MGHSIYFSGAIRDDTTVPEVKARLAAWLYLRDAQALDRFFRGIPQRLLGRFDAAGAAWVEQRLLQLGALVYIVEESYQPFTPGGVEPWMLGVDGDDSQPQWWLVDVLDEVQGGPLTRAQLVAMALHGQLMPTDQVWRVGMGWPLPLRMVAWLGGALPADRMESRAAALSRHLPLLTQTGSVEGAWGRLTLAALLVWYVGTPTLFLLLYRRLDAYDITARGRLTYCIMLYAVPGLTMLWERYRFRAPDWASRLRVLLIGMICSTLAGLLAMGGVLWPMPHRDLNDAQLLTIAQQASASAPRLLDATHRFDGASYAGNVFHSRITLLGGAPADRNALALFAWQRLRLTSCFDRRLNQRIQDGLVVEYDFFGANGQPLLHVPLHHDACLGNQPPDGLAPLVNPGT